MIFETKWKVLGDEFDPLRISKRIDESLSINFERTREGLFVIARGPLSALQELKRRAGSKRGRNTTIEVLSLCRIEQ